METIVGCIKETGEACQETCPLFEKCFPKEEE